MSGRGLLVFERVNKSLRPLVFGYAETQKVLNDSVLCASH